MRYIAWICGAMMFVPAAPVHGQTQSPELAKQCIAAMAAGHLDAFAAKQNDDGRFVAVMAFPNVQLLAVAARVPTPAVVQRLIDAKEYSEAYSILNQLAVPESKLFVHDMKADGLYLVPNGTVDVVYEQVVNQMIFDGEPSKHAMTKKQYEDKLMAADAAYSQLLTDLLKGLRSAAGTR